MIKADGSVLVHSDGGSYKPLNWMSPPCRRAEEPGRWVVTGKSGETLDGTSYILIRQAGESGQLYGSVSGRDVADAVNAEGGKVERAMVVLDKPIKTLGMHEVKVRLHPEVTVTVTLNIARSQDEAERQARGENVINSQFEEERLAADQAAADLLEGGAGQLASEFASPEA